MTDVDLLTPPGSQSLKRPLTSEQLDLLETIWRPCADGEGWPVWDYVARTLFRHEPPILDAGALWMSLPTVQRDHRQGRYGLCWRTDNSTTVPLVETTVGLSIAGLHALGARDDRAGALADAVTSVIGRLVAQAREVEPRVREPIDTRVSVIPHVRAAVGGAGAGVVDQLNVVEILQREYAPLDLVEGQDGGFTTRPGLHLSTYYGLDRAADYLDLIAGQAEPRPPAPPVSPLMVAQMLDHLSLTLRAHPRWDTAFTLVTTPDHRAAGTLALPVHDAVDFRDRTSALAQIVEALKVPLVKAEDRRDVKSLQRLEDWIAENVADQFAREDALAAVGDIRAIIALRVEGQHPGAGPKKNAARARRRLGLEEIISDWPRAWSQVLGRMVMALETIRQAVK